MTTPLNPRCTLCGEPKSKHTKREADWRDVPGCTGHYLNAAPSAVNRPVPDGYIRLYDTEVQDYVLVKRSRP
jgi:hypothetical protein